jgi:aromatase
VAQQTQDQARSVEHEITVRAAAGDVFRLIAEVRNWPQLFPPTIHVEHLGGDDEQERIRIWATANGEPKSWTSRRRLDRAAGRIDFRQEVSSPPVAAMGGAWIIEPAGAGESRVRLLHDYRAVDDDPATLEWIDRAVDRNSRTELAALKESVELAVAGDRLLSFEDSVLIDGAAADVYDFLHEAARWPERLPHVASVSCTEPDDGLQVLEMDTRATDGSTHTTRSFRVCRPGRIHYKQVTLPPLLSLHTGYWTVEQTGDGVRAASQHTVLINPERIAGIPGAGSSLAEAKEFAQRVLSANSRATLAHAKEHAERRTP